MKQNEDNYTEGNRTKRQASNTEKHKQVPDCVRRTGRMETEAPRIECSLEELGEIELVRVYNSREENYADWKTVIEQYHYLGHGTLYGKQMGYLIKSARFGWIGALSFSSPAWRLRAREEWIGWDEENRLKHLNRIVCNSRFLIVPQVKVKNLASHVLSMGMRQMKKDWGGAKWS
ncbi:MAG: DUF4338 domain-containing protein [Candidatus Brocadiaceae bacterium]